MNIISTVWEATLVLPDRHDYDAVTETIFEAFDAPDGCGAILRSRWRDVSMTSRIGDQGRTEVRFAISEPPGHRILRAFQTDVARFVAELGLEGSLRAETIVEVQDREAIMGFLSSALGSPGEDS